MKVRVQQTFVHFTDIEVPDEIATNLHELRKFWINYSGIVEPTLDELNWTGTDFINAETSEELGDID